MTEDEARERILSTAEELYYRKGYAAVGMDELRQEAGVSLRRLYSLFPSKTDIVVAVLARKHAEWESGLSGAVADAGGDPRARLLAVYGYLENWFCADDFRGCAFINAFGELGGTNPEVAEIVRAHKASFQEYMAGLVAQTGASPRSPRSCPSSPRGRRARPRSRPTRQWPRRPGEPPKS